MTSDAYWAPVPGFGNEYEVSREGEIRNALTGKHLKPAPSKTRYGRLKIRLRRYGERKTFWVARLVLLAFVGPAPFPGAEAGHQNFDVTDNRLQNLKWETHKENVRHAMLAGRRARKISAFDVRVIRGAAEGGCPASAEQLAAVFQLHVRTVQRIVKGELWGWVQ